MGIRRDLFSASAAIALAQAHLYSGDAETCIRVLRDAATDAGPDTIDPMSRCGLLELLALAEATQGRPDRAAEWADRAEAEAAGWSTPRRLGLARLTRAHALLRTDPAESGRVALAAVEAFAPYDQVARGRAHLYAGIALAHEGVPDRARAEFAQARTLLAACGAHLFVAQADREERRMNARGPRRAGLAIREAPEQALTPREWEVARLVTQGLTNREIAQRLFLSPKTVDVHLTRIYAKLGVARRAALVELLTRVAVAGPES
jgi:DNA-binding CsgD family transcriptional regulator